MLHLESMSKFMKRWKGVFSQL